ncbi:MAG: hypothetical protein WAT67_03550 [Candidatus Contendobacter sp.]
MTTKLFHQFLFLAAAVWFAPGGAMAQDDGQGFGSEYGRDRPRGQIQVTNDWRDTVTVTLWTHQRERIGSSWEIDVGDTAYLAIDQERIRVRPNYKIKVGEDWGWVNVGDVAEFRRGVWYANVRDIWRATHRRGERGERRDRDRENDAAPDWQR